MFLISYFIGCALSFILFIFLSSSSKGRKNINEKRIGILQLAMSMTICTILSWIFIIVIVIEIGGKK